MSNSNPENQRPNQAGSSGNSMLILQGVLLAGSVPLFLFNKTLHCIVAAHVAGLIHYYNLPQMNAAYWQRVFLDDNLHSLMFSFIFLILPSMFIWTVPAAIGIIFYLGLIGNNLGVTGSLGGVANKIYNQSYYLLQLRADAEMWIGFALIVMTCFGVTSFVSPIIYWQYQRMRYLLNSFSKKTYARLRMQGDQFFNTTPAKPLWDKLKSFMDYLGSVERNQNGCQIF